MIQIYNTLTHSKAPFVPAVPGRASIYVCGVTPYAEAHVGHARPAVIWDVIKRHLERRGYVVFHVQNFTDMDDKMVARASASGESVYALAERNMQRYLGELRALQVDLPQVMPRVTQSMEAILRYVEVLIDKGYAYATESGDVYFEVSKKPDYGKLSRRSLGAEQSGHRSIVEAAGKRSHEDFSLWKAARPGEPVWPSPWGPGRPGWHIECSAMSDYHLGTLVDLHGGGVDLVFPHHENELAQTEAHAGHAIQTIFVHNGLVTIEDVKMSKSLGNGITVSSLLERFHPAVLRTYLLSAHYRSPLAFDDESLFGWQRALEKLWAVYRMAEDMDPPGTWPHASWIDDLLGFEEAFLAAMDDDFNTPKALAMVFDMVRTTRPIIDRGGLEGLVAGYLIAKNLRQADRLFQFLPRPGSAAADDLGQKVLQGLLDARAKARAEKAYDRADVIRKVLLDAGWRIEDTPAGPRLIAEPIRSKANS